MMRRMQAIPGFGRAATRKGKKGKKGGRVTAKGPSKPAKVPFDLSELDPKTFPGLN